MAFFSVYAVGTRLGFSVWRLGTSQALELMHTIDCGGVSCISLYLETAVAIVAGSGDNPNFSSRTMRVYRLSDGTLLYSSSFSMPIRSIQMSENHALVAVGTDTNLDAAKIHIFELRPFNCIGEIAAHCTPLHTVPFVPTWSHTHAALISVQPHSPAGAKDGSASSIIMSSLNPLRVLQTSRPLHKDSLQLLAMSDNDRWLMTCSERGTIFRLWTLPKMELAGTFRRGSRPATVTHLTFSSCDSPVTRLASSDRSADPSRLFRDLPNPLLSASASASSDTIHIFLLPTVFSMIDELHLSERIEHVRSTASHSSTTLLSNTLSTVSTSLQSISENDRIKAVTQSVSSSFSAFASSLSSALSSTLPSSVVTSLTTAVSTVSQQVSAGYQSVTNQFSSLTSGVQRSHLQLKLHAGSCKLIRFLPRSIVPPGSTLSRAPSSADLAPAPSPTSAAKADADSSFVWREQLLIITSSAVLIVYNIDLCWRSQPQNSSSSGDLTSVIMSHLQLVARPIHEQSLLSIHPEFVDSQAFSVPVPQSGAMSSRAEAEIAQSIVQSMAQYPSIIKSNASTSAPRPFDTAVPSSATPTSVSLQEQPMYISQYQVSEEPEESPRKPHDVPNSDPSVEVHDVPNSASAEVHDVPNSDMNPSPDVQAPSALVQSSPQFEIASQIEHSSDDVFHSADNSPQSSPMSPLASPEEDLELESPQLAAAIVTASFPPDQSMRHSSVQHSQRSQDPLADSLRPSNSVSLQSIDDDSFQPDQEILRPATQDLSQSLVALPTELEAIQAEAAEQLEHLFASCIN